MTTLGLLLMFAFNFKDIHTYGNVDEVRTTHLSLELALDFDKKVITGSTTATLKYAKDKVDHVDLDTDGLTISSIKDAKGNSYRYELGKKTGYMGTRLRVFLNGKKPEKLTIKYTTDPGAEAVQWLGPEKTTSGKYPFLFTQSQSIFARTWIPCMDSPGVRVTYDAVVKVPKGITPVMSAEHGKHDKAKGIYRFKLDKAIPPYLIALAAGELAFKEIGPRTGVYAEPAVVEKAAWEFADMEKMVIAAEKGFGEYRWGRWDAIVLPPSFPFGGMENPLLTFATPTLIAGDRSLVSVMAHELAHSWTGNLVTNATWADFWLNEGYTTYLERRLVEMIYGADIATMQKILGQGDLRGSIADFNKQNLPGDTILHVDLKGRHPDDGMTDIPYEKGANMLLMLETHFGRKDFDAYLNTYFDTYAFQSITTEEGLAFMKKELFKGDDALWKKLKIQEWVYNEGLPANLVIPKSDKFKITSAAAKTFAKTGDLKVVNKDWITVEWLDFLNALPQKVDADKLAALEKAHNLNKVGNSEILFAWQMVAIRNTYKPALQSVEDFLSRMGRRKFLKPLYQALHDNPKTRDFGAKVYKKVRNTYHPISFNTIDKIYPQ